MLIVLLVMLWGWFYWGWHQEQQAVATLQPVYQRNGSLAPALQEWLGAPGFVLDRVDALTLGDHADSRDLAALASFSRLETLDVSGTRMADLRPLARLTKLRNLNLARTSVTDLNPLAGLGNLEQLDCSQSPVTEFAPLSGLMSLRHLKLPKESVTEAQADALRRLLPNCRIDRK